MAHSGWESRQVLLIDLNAPDRDTVGWLLQNLGHRVAEVESGSTGIALLRQQPVDLALTALTPGVSRSAPSSWLGPGTLPAGASPGRFSPFRPSALTSFMPSTPTPSLNASGLLTCGDLVMTGLDGTPRSR